MTMKVIGIAVLATFGLAISVPAFAAGSPAMIKHGHAVYEKWCAGCHDPDPARQKDGGGLVGRVYAGTYTLQQKYKGSKPAALVQRTDLTASGIRERVRHGYNVMPFFRKTEVSDADLEAVIAYLTRNNKN